MDDEIDPFAIAMETIKKNNAAWKEPMSL